VDQLKIVSFPSSSKSRERTKVAIDSALNIIFGLIGFVSLLYAVWQNRAAQSARALNVKVTRNIQTIAREIMKEAPGTQAMAYAKSIVEVAGSLVPKAALDVIGNGTDFELEFMPMQLRSRMAAASAEPTAAYGYALRATYKGPAVAPASLPADVEGGLPFDSVLAYGPYSRLPVAGRYEAEFRICRDAAAPLDSEPLLRLDVYEFDRDRYHATRLLTTRDVSAGWKQFGIDFDYTDTAAKLEFRAAVLRPDVRISLDTVVVKIRRQY
jgi:hypothetical protein